MKIFRIAATLSAFVALSWLSACSTKGEEAEVKEEAAQIEEARIAGREAARPFVSRRWTDSIQLQEQMVEAGSKRALYDSLPRSRAAFDSAFISTVRTVQPEVAARLQRMKYND